MRQDPFFKQLWRSISSVRFYQELATRRLSEGVKYFALLILFVAVTLSIRFTAEVFKGLSEFETWSKAYLPEITIEKGTVSVNSPQPWKKEVGDFVVVIDTTGETQTIESHTRGLLLTRNSLILKSPYETRQYDLSKVDSFRLDAQTVARIRKIGRWVLPPLSAIFLFIDLARKIFPLVVFFSVISLLANWFAKRNLSYGTLLAIGMYATTPPLLLFACVALLGIEVRFLGMVYLSSYAALLVAAIVHSPPRQGDPL